MSRVFTLAGALMLASCLSFGGQLRFRGTVNRGEPFLHRLDNELAFGLDPMDWRTPNCDGWHVWIGPSRIENFADLATGPLHGFSTLDICAADFRNSNNSGPNIGDVNRPGKVRQFRFVTSRAEDQQLSRLAEDPAAANAILAHIRFNKGSLTITRLSLGHLQPGTPPTIEEMDFIVTMDIPKGGSSLRSIRVLLSMVRFAKTVRPVLSIGRSHAGTQGDRQYQDCMAPKRLYPQKGHPWLRIVLKEITCTVSRSSLTKNRIPGEPWERSIVDGRWDFWTSFRRELFGAQ